MQITGPFFTKRVLIIRNKPSRKPARDFKPSFLPLYNVGIETIFPIGDLTAPPPSSFRRTWIICTLIL